jgi:hypothetical protein
MGQLVAGWDDFSKGKEGVSINSKMCSENKVATRTQANQSKSSMRTESEGDERRGKMNERREGGGREGRGI